MKYILIILLATTTLSAQNILRLNNDLKEYKTTNLNVSLTPAESKKSPLLAILFSAVLPGMGEFYAGNYSSGKYFTIAEGALWGTYIGMNTYAGIKKDNYKSYAQSNAGVNLDNKDEEYFSTIGLYNNIDAYNDEMALNRDFNLMLNKDTHGWDWGTTDKRRSYRDTYLSSEQTYNNLRFVVGAMIVNRIVSAINAVRLVSAHNKNLNVSWNMTFGYDPNYSAVSNLNIGFVKSF